MAVCEVIAGTGLIVGLALAIDGDTIRIGRACIQLFGIDAPERQQTCQIAGKSSPCGEEAAEYLDLLVGDHIVTCHVRALADDRYLADCDVAGHDLAVEMVASGLAMDWPIYSKGFFSVQQGFAQAGRAGMWAGSFLEPWVWRAKWIAGQPDTPVPPHAAISSAR